MARKTKIKADHYGKLLNLPPHLKKLSEEIEKLTRETAYAGNRHASSQTKLEELEDQFNDEAVKLYGKEAVLKAIDNTK